MLPPIINLMDGSRDNNQSEEHELRNRQTAETASKTSSKSCFLPRKVRVALIATLALLVLGAAVGGGVAGGIAHEKSEKAEEAEERAAESAKTSNISTIAHPNATAAPNVPGTAGTIVGGYLLELWSGQNFSGKRDEIWQEEVVQEPLDLSQSEPLPNKLKPLPPPPAMLPPGASVLQVSEVKRIETVIPFSDDKSTDDKAQSWYWHPNDSGCCVQACRNGGDVVSHCDPASVTDGEIDRAVIACGEQLKPELCRAAA